MKPSIIDAQLLDLQIGLLNEHIHGKESNLDLRVHKALLGIENLLDLIYDRLIDDGTVWLRISDRIEAVPAKQVKISASTKKVKEPKNV